MKSLPISKVAVEERFVFRQVEHEELSVFRCVARYGYTDVQKEEEAFEDLLVKRLKEFIVNSGEFEGVEKEVEAIEKAVRGGVVHLIGESEVVACKGASIRKRILINYAYNFLKKNLRQSDKLFHIPHKRMVKVGMTYEL